ncbi:hypothetical protein DWU98_12790 [Dyella monticola]|uniref:Nucleotidyltransferase family protein n=2 Tax=Dyella monticola TaxID=1927958 RepID=A0A370WXG2_9GAMM|nr:hypothetical protein DWU98_12790 [Dyella monticola]
MMQLTPALREVMAASMPQLKRHCRDPWVVIGSAACALAGATVNVADLDLLTSVADAEHLMALWPTRLDMHYSPADSERFRSRFARFRFPGMPLEVMGGLQWHDEGGWQSVLVNDVVKVDVADVAVPIPSRTEQIRILERFGRPKDLARAELLRAL